MMNQELLHNTNKRRKTNHGPHAKRSSNSTNVIVPPNDDALFKTITNGCWEQSRRLLESNDATRLVAYVNVRDGDGRGPLHEICLRNGPPDIVRAILGHCIRSNNISSSTGPPLAARTNSHGITPLHWACSYSSEEVILMLLEAAPQAASITNDCGKLPLHNAIGVNRHPDLIHRLMTETAKATSNINSDANGEIPAIKNHHRSGDCNSITSGEYFLENWYWSL